MDAINHSNLNYNQCVEYGKRLLDDVREAQIELCRLAMTVVTISNGGIGSKKFYTISDFAKDIGMKKNTLSKWLEVYNDVYSKFDEVGNPKEAWQLAKKINKNLKHERQMINKELDQPRSQAAKKIQDISPARINKLREDIYEKPFVSEFRQAFQHAKHMQNLFDKRDLSIIEDQQLLLLATLLNKTSERINKHIRNKPAFKFGA